MSNENKQPKEYDAVLGGNNPLDLDSAVLGGIEGVKKQLESKDDSLKIAAVKQALNYGEAGLNLVIECLKSENFAIQKAAYCLLSKRKEKKAIQAMKELNKYLFFECKLTIQAHLHFGFSPISITNDGETIISCTAGKKTIKVWSSKTRKLLKILTSHTKQVNYVAINNDDKIILSTSDDCTIKIWSLKTGQLLKTIETKYPRDYITTSAEGKYIVVTTKPIFTELGSGGSDRIDILDFRTGKLLYYLNLNDVYSLDVATRHLFQYSEPGYVGFHSPVITNDGENIIFSFYDEIHRICKIAIWNFKTGSLSNLIKDQWAYCLKIDRQDRFIVSNFGFIWDIKTGNLLQQVDYPYDLVCVAIGSNGKTLISGDYPEGNLKIWDIKTGKLLQILEGHSDGISSILVSKDGEIMVTKSVDGTIKLWGIPET